MRFSHQDAPLANHGEAHCCWAETSQRRSVGCRRAESVGPGADTRVAGHPGVARASNAASPRHSTAIPAERTQSVPGDRRAVEVSGAAGWASGGRGKVVLPSVPSAATAVGGGIVVTSPRDVFGFRRVWDDDPRRE